MVEGLDSKLWYRGSVSRPKTGRLMALLSRLSKETKLAITPSALQTALGVTIGDPLVVRADETAGSDATKQEWLVHGRGTVPGRVRWVVCTASDNAATQAAACLAALRA